MKIEQMILAYAERLMGSECAGEADSEGVLPKDLREIVEETVSYRVEMILEKRLPNNEDSEDLEQLVLDKVSEDLRREVEELLEQGISRAAIEQQVIYKEAFLDGFRLGSQVFRR